MAVGSTFSDGWYWSADGLRLHYRDHAGPDGRPVLLCLPGLTRSARDFEGVAAHYGGHWRVICADLRGRGESAYAKDSLSYVPLTYAQDIAALIAAAGIERFVAIGTSLGGIVSMLLAGTSVTRMAGVVLNDIGPVIEANGLARIRANVGRSSTWPTWLHAARELAGRNAGIYPGWATPDWLLFAKRLCRLTPAGRIVFDYDARIADAMQLPGTDLDLWSAFAALANVPVLSVRGELSDVLTVGTQVEMATRHPGLRIATIHGVGHAPTLDEAESVAAIDLFLAEILKG